MKDEEGEAHITLAQEWKKDTKRQSIPCHDAMPSVYREQCVLTPPAIPKPCKLGEKCSGTV